MQPNLDNIRKWRDALLSGRFEQGYYYLKDLTADGPKYCCLGVACEIAKENGVSMTEKTRSGTRVGKVLYDGESATLPIRVQEWLGIGGGLFSMGNPRLSHQFTESLRYEMVEATSLNDNHNLSFKQIAAAITRTYNLD